MANLDVKKAQNTITKYLLYVNVITLVVSFWFLSVGFLIFILIFNTFMIAVHKLLKKNEDFLEQIVAVNKFARGVDNLAGKING